MGAKVLATDYHRNGVGGEGFRVSIVQDDEYGRMLVVDFSYAHGTDEGAKYGYTAVLNLDEAARGNIYMFPEIDIPNSGGNAWRGDRMGDQYRPLITKFSDERYEGPVENIEGGK